MDWLAGLGEGFKGIGPAIQMLMMLQQAKAESQQRGQFHTEDIAAADRRHSQDVGIDQARLNQEGAQHRMDSFLQPLQRQGMFPGAGDYGAAARIEAPPLTPNINPAAGAMQAGQGLAGAAGQSEDRLGQLRMSAAQALQKANQAGPGAVQSFGQGGIAIGQQPYPTHSVSESHSFAGVDPNQLKFKMMDSYVDGLNRFVSNAISEYKAINGPWGGNVEEVIQDATRRFEAMWPSIQKQFFGGDGTSVPPPGGGLTGFSHTETGGPQAGPQIPQNQQDLNTRANRYRARITRRP